MSSHRVNFSGAAVPPFHASKYPRDEILPLDFQVGQLNETIK